MAERIGFGLRLGAFIIDIILTWIVAIVISRIFPDLFLNSVQTSLANMISKNQFLASVYDEQTLPIVISFSRVVLIVNIARLLVFLPEIFCSASVGKMLFKLQIVSADGVKADVGMLVWRYVVKHIGKITALLAMIVLPALFNTLSTLLGFVVFVGCFFAAGERHQALHDVIFRTAVTRRSASTQAATEQSSSQWV